jgi:hypothetical protein
MKSQNTADFLVEKLAERASSLANEKQRLSIRRAELTAASLSIETQLVTVEAEIAELDAELTAQATIADDIQAVAVKKKG